MLNNIKEFFKEFNINLNEKKLKEIKDIIDSELPKYYLNNKDFRDTLLYNTDNNDIYEELTFNDTIISITEIDPEELYDIEVKYSLFYANNILTHNSSYGAESNEVSMANISESIGIAATADLLVALIQSEAMREENKVILKFMKNRLEGFLGDILLKSDYFHMRYTDYVDSNSYISKPKVDIANEVEDLGLGDFKF